MSALDTLHAIADKADALLQGEPARAIGYGAAVVVVGVVALANYLGFARFGDNLDIATAVGLTTTAIGTVVTVIEGIRKFVFSPATVEAIVAETDGDST